MFVLFHLRIFRGAPCLQSKKPGSGHLPGCQMPPLPTWNICRYHTFSYARPVLGLSDNLAWMLLYARVFVCLCRMVSWIEQSSFLDPVQFFSRSQNQT